jgi:hypothetical protein
VIHVVGDSHVMLFTGQKLPYLIQPPVDFAPNGYDLIEGYVTYFCVLLRAYRFIDNGYVWQLLEHIPKGSTVILVVGEIDCRGPILNEANRTGKTIYETTDVCAERYLTGVRRVKEMGLNPVIFAPYPQRMLFEIKHDWVKLPEYLSPAQWCLRKKSAIYHFESVLRLSEFPVVSINEWFDDYDVESSDDYWADAIHLSERAWPFIENEISRVLPLP